MNSTYFLIFAALFPAVVLCIYVYRKDRVEKEPILLLLKLLCMGALCCFPAAYAESALISVLDMFGVWFYTHTFIENFFCVALIEEGFKLIVLLYVTRRNEEFNCLFDGLIYAIFVSLGFAAFENIFYVLEYGFSNAVMRAILSVPGHMFFAVMMGYNYSLWHISKERKYMIYCLAVPTMAHGFYNFCCSVPAWWSTLIFYGFVALMYKKCFGKINEISYMDTYIE